MNKEVGRVNTKVIKLLNLKYKQEIPIMIGETNIEHMKRKHPNDYEKYWKDIEEIIRNPTYVAKNPKQDSIEYIKEYYNEDEFVLIAVRVSNRGDLFVRTLFTMTDRKKNIYLNKGYAKKY